MTDRGDHVGGAFPPPYALGAPKKFKEWRPEQLDALTRISDGRERAQVIAAPTGIGKSIIAAMTGRMMGWRTLILTSTKGLQNQYLRDYAEEMGLTDIRGQGNYPCLALRDGGELEYLRPDNEGTVGCDRGPCHGGVGCPIRESKCAYYAEALPRARRAESVISNYSYWLSISDPEKTLGAFDCLILDESHSALSELAGALSVTLTSHDCMVLNALPRDSQDVKWWQSWGNHQYNRVGTRLESITYSLRLGSTDTEMAHEAMVLRAIQKKLQMISSMDSSNWVVERVGKDWQFDCVWPARHAEQKLFRGIKHLVLLSATIRPKTLELLGIAEESAFVEYDSSFPLRQRPIYYLPSVRMNWKTTEEGLREWMRVIDQFVGPRTDRKGIIHTTSYARRNYVLEHSEHREIMLRHSSRDTLKVVEEFKRAKPPAILPSPSIATGYDFPYYECEWQVIGKIPYPDSRSKVMEARRKMDPTYLAYIAATEMVQASGRGVRFLDDQCETAIVDDSWLWFRKQYWDFFPKWWMRAVKHVPRGAMPPVLRRLAA